MTDDFRTRLDNAYWDPFSTIWDCRVRPPAPTVVWPEELAELARLAGDTALPHGNILEIGICWWGTGVAMWQSAQEAGRGDELVVGLDPLCDKASGFAGGAQGLAVLATVDAHPGMKYFDGTTDDLRKLNWGRSFRLIDVDGDHSHEWARKDLEYACSVVVDGGIIAMHDATESEGVPPIWQALERGDYNAVGTVVLEPLRLVNTLAIMRAVVL
jgi:hypothetical protein